MLYLTSTAIVYIHREHGIMSNLISLMFECNQNYNFSASKYALKNANYS